MFFSLSAARNGEVMALGGSIETIGNQAFVFDLTHIDGNTAHITLLLTPHKGTPEDAEKPVKKPVQELFTVTTDVTKVVIHVLAPTSTFSYGLPLIARS